MERKEKVNISWLTWQLVVLIEQAPLLKINKAWTLLPG